MRDFYDREHWEQLIGTIIDRLGVDQFFEMIAYVLEQRGCANITAPLRHVAHQLAGEADDAD